MSNFCDLAAFMLPSTVVISLVSLQSPAGKNPTVQEVALVALSNPPAESRVRRTSYYSQ